MTVTDSNARRAVSRAISSTLLPKGSQHSAHRRPPLESIHAPPYGANRRLRQVWCGATYKSTAGTIHGHDQLEHELITIHQNSTPLDLSDESAAAGAHAVFDDAHATVRDEDYRLVEGLQANLESGARDQLVLGRNEPGLQPRHITWVQTMTLPPTTQ